MADADMAEDQELASYDGETITPEEVAGANRPG